MDNDTRTTGRHTKTYTVINVYDNTEQVAVQGIDSERCACSPRH